ncbi:MAG: hypothetical protein ACRBG0_15210 [Lewinella sp.]|uniref:hypothetical protein n=1 Tax=Lewinella sp. TaxID=2004506 RepID=UPI003D6AF74B
MKFKFIQLIELSFYLLGLYLCLVWAKWVTRPNWIQEDIEPIYATLGVIGMICAFIWRFKNTDDNSGIIKRFNNIVRGNWINLKGDFHVGNIGENTDKTEGENNVVENNIINANKFRVGDKNE